MTELKKFRIFWVWDDEKEENWLRAMSQNGWHFSTVSLPGNYTFIQGEPKDYVYRLDYQPERKDFANYLQLFRDAGWDYLGDMNNWQYFRKEATNGEELDIYSDAESKSKKYRRILLILVALLPLYLNAINLVSKRGGAATDIFGFVMLMFLGLYAYAIIRLWMRIDQLKKKL